MRPRPKRALVGAPQTNDGKLNPFAAVLYFSDLGRVRERCQSSSSTINRTGISALLEEV